MLTNVFRDLTWIMVLTFKQLLHALTLLWVAQNANTRKNVITAIMPNTGVFVIQMNILDRQALNKMVSVIQMAIYPFKSSPFSNLILIFINIIKKRALSVLLSKREPFSLIFRSHKGISVPPINSIHGLTGEQWHGHPAFDRYSTFCSLEFMKPHWSKSRTNTHTHTHSK